MGMTSEAFCQLLLSGKATNHGELLHNHALRAQRVKAQINSGFHTPEELRKLMAELIGKDVPDDFSLFPPIYSDFGLNITLGKGVFVNSDCHFQDHGGVTLGDGTLVGPKVVFATLNHLTDPNKRHTMIPKPIILGKNVLVGASAIFLPGVTVGDGAIVAAGAVVNHDVPARTIVGGVPARVLKTIE